MKTKGLSKKLRLSRFAILALSIIVALSTVGVSYAKMKGPKPPKDDVVITSPITSPCSDPFTWVTSNDDGVEEDNGGYFPVDPSDDDTNNPDYDGWGASSSGDPYEPQALGSPFDDRYTKDVAKTEAWLGTLGPNDPDPDPQYITVVIDNAYPLYHSTIFFALECPSSTQGVIQDIVIDEDTNDPDVTLIDELTVTYSEIEKFQPIPAGGEVAGALHILVNQSAAQGATYKISLSINTECGTQQSGTAYAYGFDYAHCFTEYGFSKWGWTNGELGPGTYVFPMYVGESDCIPSEENLIGTVTISYDDSTDKVIVDYLITDPIYTLGSTHVWAGDEPFPRKGNNYTAAPGQYGSTNTTPDSDTTDQHVIENVTPNSSGKIWVIAHAVPQWYE
jgi:hypothetical protein